MRFWRWNVRGLLADARQQTKAAVMPAAGAAVLGPLAVALVPLFHRIAVEFIPNGPERLILLAAVFALGAEVVRCHVIRFSLARRLRDVTAPPPPPGRLEAP
jgi:hypothetical protein